MRRIAFSVLWVLVVVGIFGGLNGFLSANYFVRQGYFNSVFRTFLPLLVSIFCAVSIGGCIGYRVPVTGRLPFKIGLGLCYAVATTILVLYLYLLIWVNVRGE